VVDMKNIAVLVSGRGSNLQAIMDAIDRGEINGRIVAVVSNRKDAYALERARQRNIPAIFIDHRRKARKDFEEEIIQALKPYSPDLIVLAGFMRILTPHFVSAYRGRIMNIHPALLPSFPGTHAQKDALEWGVKVTGCTVHFVDEVTDHGPIIIQRAVEVMENDTVETLAARILEQEHKAFPEAVKLFCEDRLVIEGRRVRILPPKE